MEKKNLVIALVLVLLIVVSGVQAFKLGSLKETIEENKMSVSSSPAVKSTSGGGATPAALPSSIKDLPQMVGGC